MGTSNFNTTKSGLAEVVFSTECECECECYCREDTLTYLVSLLEDKGFNVTIDGDIFIDLGFITAKWGMQLDSVEVTITTSSGYYSGFELIQRYSFQIESFGNSDTYDDLTYDEMCYEFDCVVDDEYMFSPQIKNRKNFNTKSIVELFEKEMRVHTIAIEECMLKASGTPVKCIGTFNNGGALYEQVA